MSRVFGLGLLVLLTIQATSAFAAGRQGVYVSAHAGVSKTADHDWFYTGRTLNNILAFERTPFLDVAMGYKYRNYRVELEGAWKRVEIATATIIWVSPDLFARVGGQDSPAGRGLEGATGRADPLDGSLLTRGLMVNGWYDVDFWGSPWVPFVGGGFGMINGKWDVQESAIATRARGAADGAAAVQAGQASHTANATRKESVRAWRVGGGLNYRLADNLELQLIYHYNRSDKLGRTREQFVFHNFGGGVRYTF